MSETLFTEFTDYQRAEIEEKQAQKLWTLGDIRLYECPLTCITPETWQIIRLVYLVDTSHHLLHPGGWGEQPAWLVEAYEIYKEERARAIKHGDGKTA